MLIKLLMISSINILASSFLKTQQNLHVSDKNKYLKYIILNYI